MKFSIKVLIAAFTLSMLICGCGGEKEEEKSSGFDNTKPVAAED